MLSQVDGLSPGDERGTSVRGAGDVNGDGLEDVVIGTPNHDTALENVGRVLVVAGGTGNGLHEFVGTEVLRVLGLRRRWRRGRE